MKELLNRFGEKFAENVSKQVVEQGRLDEVYELAMGHGTENMRKLQAQRTIFHAAYVLEYVYFNYKSYFCKYTERFMADFMDCRNHSARRHFAKMVCDIFKSGTELRPSDYNRVATTLVEWVTEPGTKVAVKIWAVEILIYIRSRVG